MESVTRKLPLVARILLGLVFFVFGLNGFLHFLPQPPMSGPSGDFAGALAATGYMFPLVKGTEVVVGVLLLAGRYVALALVLLAPVMVNILAFHGLLAPSGLAIPIVCLLLHVYLAWVHRAAYAPLFAPRLEPARPALAAAR